MEGRRGGIWSVVESNLPDVFTAIIALDVTIMARSALWIAKATNEALLEGPQEVILVWLSEILLYPNTHHPAHMSLARRDAASFMKSSPERKSFCPATPNVRYIVLLRPYLSSPPTMTGISPAASAIRRPWLVATGVSLRSPSLETGILWWILRDLNRYTR